MSRLGARPGSVQLAFPFSHKLLFRGILTGATLDYVIVDLNGCFTSGQAYVALSRARTMLGLQIKNFDPKHVKIEPLVSHFYEALDRGNMKSFLEEEAGIWWFPILDAPAWLDMFCNASNQKAKENAEQFCSWVNEYRPLEGYRGWGCRNTTATPPPAVAPLSAYKPLQGSVWAEFEM